MKNFFTLVASIMMLFIGCICISCSDSADSNDAQEVKVITQTTGEDYEYYGYFSGESSYYLPYIKTNTISLVSWSTKVQTNRKEYTLKIPLYISYSQSYTSTLTIYNVNGKYYDTDMNEITFGEGSPESNSFTISSTITLGYQDGVSWKKTTFSSITFTRL